MRQWVAVPARVLEALATVMALLAIILPAAVELALPKTPFRPKSPSVGLCTVKEGTIAMAT